MNRESGLDMEWKTDLDMNRKKDMGRDQKMESDIFPADEKDTCTCTIIHEDAVRKARSGMPENIHLYDLAEVFKVFSDQTRIRILCALIETELCVCDISSLLEMSQSSISHQLRVLKQANLVKYRKEGKVVYYSLKDGHVQQIFAQALLHVKE